VDLIVAGGRSSLELSPPVATVLEKSPRWRNMERATTRSSPEASTGGAVMEGGRRQGNKFAAASSRGHEAWNRMRQRCGEGRGDVRCLL
jgi:hypothetical protein